jgi:hypothetical protein
MLPHLLLCLLLTVPSGATPCDPDTPVARLGSDLALAVDATAQQLDTATRLRHTVTRILREEAEQGPSSAADGWCLDLAAKWQVRLAEEGIAAHIATVDPARREPGTPVRRGMEGKFHAFVVIEAHGAEPLIVDGSWRQFIEGAEASPGLPEVFVGTLDELIGALARHQPALRIEIHDDPLLGQRDPRETAELAYGAGPWAELRELLPRP